VSKRYSRANITTTPDTLATQRDYGNRVADAIVRNSAALPETNEAAILTKALEADSKEALAQIEISRAAYEAMIREILVIPVPESMTSEHLALVNALQTIHDDIASVNIKAMLKLSVNHFEALVVL
jgi:MoxR-like ATPase